MMSQDKIHKALISLHVCDASVSLRLSTGRVAQPPVECACIPTGALRYVLWPDHK